VSRVSTAHQNNKAIQCHSRWYTLEKYRTEEKLKTDSTVIILTKHNPKKQTTQNTAQQN